MQVQLVWSMLTDKRLSEKMEGKGDSLWRQFLATLVLFDHTGSGDSRSVAIWRHSLGCVYSADTCCCDTAAVATLVLWRYWLCGDTDRHTSFSADTRPVATLAMPALNFSKTRI